MVSLAAKTTVPAAFPPSLKAGGTVGIISPARWPEPEWISAPKAFLERLGYKVIVHPQNYLKEGQLAGSDAARAAAIMDMFADKSIDAILCARGGTGSIYLSELLDFDLIRKNPKPFIGFSDITILLQVITQQCGFVTFHGPMGWNFGQANNDLRTSVDLAAALASSCHEYKFSAAEVEVVRVGQAEGVLTGGNIALLQSLIGTGYDWSARDGILFLEDTEEPLYKLDRMLEHFSLAGKFQGVRAVIIGEMTDITDDDVPYGRDFRQIVQNHVPQDVPLCFNFPCGHGAYITTLPVGARARLTLDKDAVALSY